MFGKNGNGGRNNGLPTWAELLIVAAMAVSLGALVVSGIAVSTPAEEPVARTYQTAFYVEQGGDKAVVASGGELEIQSGGTLDVQSGAIASTGAMTITDLTVSDDLTVTDALQVNGNATLGNASSDLVRTYGRFSTYDGNDWIDITDVGALGRANMMHVASKIVGWGDGTDTQMQAIFANTQVSATMAATQTVYGIEGKATASNGGRHLGTGIGVFGKVTVKDSGTKLEYGYPFYSILDLNNSAVITTGASYYAEASGEATAGTIAVLQTKASDTWDYGVDFNGSTMSEADIRLQNGETISNVADGDVQITGDLLYQTNVVSTAVAYQLLPSETGSLVTNPGRDTHGQVFTLPVASAGYNFCFYVGASGGITVTPGSGDYILHLTNAADDRVANTTVGDSVCVTAIDSIWWVPTQEIGTWSDVDH